MALNMTFKGRSLKMIDEKLIAMSARDKPDDWDFAGDAFAFSVDSEVIGLKVIDENRLLIATVQGDYILSGDPMESGRLCKVSVDLTM